MRHPSITGGCLCGAVRYSCHEDMLWAGLCHCPRCQMRSGGAYSAFFVMPIAETHVVGRTQGFDWPFDDGVQVETDHICAECGTRVFARLSGWPDRIYFFAPTLDDPSLFQPIANVYSSTKCPWADYDPTLMDFPERPPARYRLPLPKAAKTGSPSEDTANVVRLHDRGRKDARALQRQRRQAPRTKAPENP